MSRHLPVMKLAADLPGKKFSESCDHVGENHGPPPILHSQARAPGPTLAPSLAPQGALAMNITAKVRLGFLASLAAVTMASPSAIAQQQQKPNILFIMGDDIGWM